MVNTKLRKRLSAVAENLKVIRGDLSQTEFAKFLGIANQVTYQRYEAGRVPKIDILQRIATRLGITLDELLTPITSGRAALIYAQAVLRDVVPSGEDRESRDKAHRAYGEAAGELITDESIKAVTKALNLESAPYEEVSELFRHLVITVNRCPSNLMKYYVLIRYAVMLQLARHHKLK